jgi:hypothetical protein
MVSEMDPNGTFVTYGGPQTPGNVRRDHFRKDRICSVRRSIDRQRNPDHWWPIEMRPDVEDSEDAPLATVVDLLNSDEPMGLSDRQIVELLESDESSSADESDSSSL